MKQAKKLTRRQKIILSSHCLNPEHWALMEETDFHLKLINKLTGTRKTIDKFIRR